MDGQKLGLDVDYMAERKLLPIMHVTGGVAEELLGGRKSELSSGGGGGGWGTREGLAESLAGL